AATQGGTGRPAQGSSRASLAAAPAAASLAAAPAAPRPCGRRAARATARLPVERLATPITLAPNTCVFEPGGACLGRQIDIAEIDENVAAHALFQRVEIERAELVPFGDHHGDVCLLGGLERAAAPDHPRQKLLGILPGVRIVDPDRRSLFLHHGN